jgi:hypothetical protein
MAAWRKLVQHRFGMASERGTAGVSVDDVERLRAMLARLKHGDEGVDDASDPDDMLAPVLQEIDETVLPRELRFRNDRGEELALIVSARRVLRIGEVQPAALAAKFAELAGHPLSEDAKPQLEAFRGLLETFLEGSEELSVTATRPATNATTSDIGCGTETLARLWSKDATGAAQDPGPHLMAALCDASGAYIAWTAGAITDSKGPASAIPLLQSLARTEGLAAPASPQDGPVCAVLPASDDQGTAVVELRDGDVRALFLLPGFSAAKIARLWQGARIDR